MNNELFFANGLAGLLNQTDDHKFIDINIDSDENDESASSDPPTTGSDHEKNNKSFLFNFKSSSSATVSSSSSYPVVKKLSQPEKTTSQKSPGDHAPLQASLSSPMSNKMKLFHLNKAADILLSNLNEMNLKDAYDDDDDDEDEETEDDEELDFKVKSSGASSTGETNGSPINSSDLIRRRLMTNGPLKYNSSSSNLQTRTKALNDANNNVTDSAGFNFDSKRNSLCDLANSSRLQHSTPLVSESSHTPTANAEHDFSMGAESLMNMSTSTRISNMSTLSSPNAADFNEALSSTMAEIGDGLNELNSSTMSNKINSSAAVFYK